MENINNWLLWQPIKLTSIKRIANGRRTNPEKVAETTAGGRFSGILNIC